MSATSARRGRLVVRAMLLCVALLAAGVALVSVRATRRFVFSSALAMTSDAMPDDSAKLVRGPDGAFLAELPRASVATTYPTGGHVVHVPPGANLQRVLDDAQPGDVLLLPAGSRWEGNFQLPVKRGAGWIVLRTDAPLVPEGRRMTPSLAASIRLARISTPSINEAIGTAPGAHHWRLTGLELTATGTQPMAYSLVRLGESAPAQTTLASVPHDVIIDRSYVHGTPKLPLKRCIVINSAATAIIDSWLEDCHGTADSQAILGYNGPGPFLIQNNRMDGSHQNIMFGGADPAIRGLVPSDITVRGNQMTRPPSWKGVWQGKTGFELKNARRVLVEGNVIENVWADAQVGFAILLKSVNQDGSAPWSTTQDVTFRYNRVRNVGAVFNIAAHPEQFPVVPAARFTIHDNITDAVNVGQFSGPGIGLQVLGDVADVSFVHNTTLNPKGNSATMFDGGSNTRFVMRSNLLAAGEYGVFGSGKGVGNGALSYYAPKAVFTENAIIGAQCGVYPAGTRCPPKLTDVGFVSAFGGDYHLGSSSPYRGRGSDKRDIGADVDRVAAATQGAVIAP